MSKKAPTAGSPAADVIAEAMVHESTQAALEALWKRSNTIRTASERDSVVAEAKAQMASLSEAAAIRTNINAVAEKRGVRAEVIDSRVSELVAGLRRIATVSERARVVHETTPFQEALTTGEGRPRTHHSRREYCVTETASAAAQEILDRKSRASDQTRTFTPPFVSGSEQRKRESTRKSAQLQEAVVAARRRAVAEVAYRAMPFDEDEKSPRRSLIIEEVEQLIGEGTGPGSEALRNLFTEVDAVVTSAGANALEEVSRCARDASTQLGSLVEQIGSAIEGRVIDAYSTTRVAAERLQRAVTEAVESAPSPELAELRKKKLQERAKPNLIEALFTANARALHEKAGGEVPAGAVVAEAVAQFTAIETLSSLGATAPVDPMVLAGRVARLSVEPKS